MLSCFLSLVFLLTFSMYLSISSISFRDVAPSAVAVLAQVKVRVPFKRFCSSRRRHYFVRQWGARGVVASVIDGQLVVHL